MLNLEGPGSPEFRATHVVKPGFSRRTEKASASPRLTRNTNEREEAIRANVRGHDQITKPRGEAPVTPTGRGSRTAAKETDRLVEWLRIVQSEWNFQGRVLLDPSRCFPTLLSARLVKALEQIAELPQKSHLGPRVRVNHGVNVESKYSMQINPT